MSRRPALDLAAGHARARELAATRLDETLPAPDATWLDAHLAGCDACRAVAADYDLGRSALRALRDQAPEPPRDLWARTSAALEAERGRPGRRRGRLGRLGLARFGRLVAAPVAAILVVAIAVSSGLLNGTGIVPGAGGPQATPIALSGAADLRVVTRSSDGTLTLVSGPIQAVCPIGSETCGAAPSFAVTQLAGVSGSSDLAVVSPGQDRAVVVKHGGPTGGVYVVPMTAAVSGPSSTASPRPTPSHGAATATSPSESPATATPVTPATPTPATSSPDATPTPDETGSPVATPSATDGSATAAPTPSIAVSPAPGGAIQIASDVTVVGDVVYSPDGTRVAFAAHPADGSRGPDIYLWTTGDTSAHALTTDHATQLAGWTSAGIVAGRVVDGSPTTLLIDPATGKSSAVPGSAWMPDVNPAGTAAAWWAGTVKLAADGVSWVPDAGNLVVGAWPPASPAPTATSALDRAAPKVIAQGSFDAWEVRWDEGGTAFAVWLHSGNADKPGRLSLYPVDPDSGLVMLAHPLLDSALAGPGFSLQSGRLVWSGPGASGQGAVQVFVWSGTNVGHLELPGPSGSTVVP